MWQAALGRATGARAASERSATPSDWIGEYFNDTTLTGAPALVRDDGPSINFDWPDAPAGGISGDYFSVRWTMTREFQRGL